MITSNALVIERCLVFVERIGCEVEYPVVEALVLQDLLICGSQGLWLLLHRFRHEHIVVEIAFVDRPHINKTNGCDECHRPCGIEFAGLIDQQQQCADKDDEE